MIVRSLIVSIIIATLLSGCTPDKFNIDSLEQLQQQGIVTDIQSETLDLEETTDEYNFIIINDSHVIDNNNEVKANEIETVKK